MSSEKFTILRSILKTLGLRPQAVDDIVDRITDFLSEKDQGNQPVAQVLMPYHVRDDFLSPAEHSFYQVLKLAVGDQALVCPKVNLGDLFYAKSSDASEYRIYTNKIDRKHIDFLLCDPQTVRPMAGLELDDKSHQRSDRQARDDFVEEVFKTARLPLVRIPARHSYAVNELRELLRPSLVGREKASAPSPAPSTAAPGLAQDPTCPKCGGVMILRKAKAGPNPGEQFWGCQEYPRCRGVAKYATAG